MSYLLDKKIRRKKFFGFAFGVIFLIVLFHFKFDIFDGLSSASQTFFRPVLTAGNSIGGKLKSVGSYFASKNSLYLQNQKLQAEARENEARTLNYNSILSENENLKAILGRLPAQAGKNEKINMVLSVILAKPDQSLYDTLVIDAGAKQGIKTGDTVFALGDVPIGRVNLVYENSAKVILFSNAGEKTQVIIPTPSFSSPKGETNALSPLGRVREGLGGDVFVEIIGRGGGNFEMILPRDLVLQKGDQVVMPGINPYVLAVVETIVSDPRDPFSKALLTSPVNIQELKFVEVEI